MFSTVMIARDLVSRFRGHAFCLNVLLLAVFYAELPSLTTLTSLSQASATPGPVVYAAANIDIEDDAEDSEEDLQSFQPDAIREAVPTPKPEVTISHKPKYKTPNTSGLHFAETFDTDPFALKRWVYSDHPKFAGKFKHAVREVEGVVGDKGISLVGENLFHGASTRIPTISTNKGQHFVLQYEVKHEKMLHCGGQYLKLFNLDGNLAKFNHMTDYVIMFGPDKCLPTNTVHFILKQKHPKTGKWTEHRFENSPPTPDSGATHLFTLWIKPDNSFEIHIDMDNKVSGHLYKNMSPPMKGPQMISDPNDTQPADWVTDAKMADPDAKQPEDWDDTQPRMIPDDSAEKPDGWLDSEAKFIEDPNATQPDDWDEKEDGKWQAPIQENPRCKAAPGCGEWKAPMVANPKYKGAWTPPLINNPAYKGEWKPRMIENPDYIATEDGHALAPMNALGFELWSVQDGVMFDNIIVSRDFERARQFAEATWRVRYNTEMAQFQASSGATAAAAKSSPLGSDLPLSEKFTLLASHVIEEYPHYIVLFVVLILTIMVLLGRRGSKAAVPSPESAVPSEDENSDDTKVDPTRADDEVEMSTKTSKKKGSNIVSSETEHAETDMVKGAEKESTQKRKKNKA
eukprot:GHVT01105012.1.p1 GENE.GHVT01105012.1~~GHVT01105012.1.p1  ORF type:complete len:628 (+),score=86.84 GHVT01105012.1:536-2419(+)